MTWHGVTQRGHTQTRSCPTTTSLTLILTLTTIMPGTTGCLRTSLARANHCFLSWWQQKMRAVCVVINNRPSEFPSLLCCHQWKATAKVEHQTCAANKPLVRTVCRHKLDTAFSFFFFFSGWDPSRLCLTSSKKSDTLWFQDQFWYMITTWKQEEDCMSPWSSLYSKKGKIWFIYSASISDFSVYTPPFIFPQNTVLHGKHTVPYQAIAPS